MFSRNLTFSVLDTALETDALYLPFTPEPTTTAAGAPMPAAQQILCLSFERNRAVRNALADFAERCERVSRFHSSSAMLTECAEYDALLAFGPSIIPHVMLQYARDVEMSQQGGGGQTSASGIGRGTLLWYELLHELVWGHKTALRTVRLGEVYARWEAWFQEGLAVEGAPRFSGEDAMV